MSQQLSLQSDLGILGLRGLEAFSSTLAALSADNVAPAAIVQMEKLGAAFHISGEHAARVPDLLRRSSSKRLERLALSIGWRQGDAASHMASSAGGQSISLLSMCLKNLYKDVDVGDILFQLCSELLPAEYTISSVSQLTEVASLLASKLSALGLGNLVARQVMKVHQVYEHLSKDVPSDFLDPVTNDSATALLHSISRALREEGLIVRITGTQGMGYVLGMVLLMFPHDAMITMDSVIIHEGVRHSILLEFCEIGAGPTRVQVETILSRSESVTLPIGVVSRTSSNVRRIELPCQFTWHGWVADKLQLTFSDAGLICPQDVFAAICDLLILLPAAIGRSLISRGEVHIPRGGLQALLGPLPLHRMQHVCQEVLRITPMKGRIGLQSAFKNLARSTTEAVARTSCSCTRQVCGFDKGWPPLGRQKRICKRLQVWAAIGQTLNDGMICFFLNPGPNATITGLSHFDLFGTISVPGFLTKELSGIGDCWSDCGRLLSMVLASVAYPTSDHAIGVSSGSSTIYPAALQNLRVPSPQRVNFELVEGRFISGGRYHSSLRSASVTDRTKAKKSLVNGRREIIPSSLGEHSDVLITIRERLDSLELRLTARVSGSNVHLNIRSVIIGFIGLDRTDPCPHPSTDALDLKYISKVVATSVASPDAQGSKVAIAMTQSNPVAQVLCCGVASRTMLQIECCLNCALEQAGDESSTIIAG
jgi:hypothetical protein